MLLFSTSKCLIVALATGQPDGGGGSDTRCHSHRQAGSSREDMVRIRIYHGSTSAAVPGVHTSSSVYVLEVK